MRRLAPLILLPALATADIVINELQTAASDRQLLYPDDGSPPRLGPAPAWQDPAFDPVTPWQQITLPAGWGHSGLATDLSSTMRGTTPTLYLRQSFHLTPAQAALPGDLELTVQADDGFVAFINGHEIARSNAAAPGAFLHFDQPAFNNTFSSTPVTYRGPAAASVLLPGTNTLAVQAHNADLDSAFRVAASLHLLGSNIDTTAARFDFDDATGATSTHTRNANASSDNTTGTPITDGWLATASPPSTSSAWSDLTVTATESAANNALVYTFDPSDPPAPITLHAPPVTMTGLWQPGNVDLTALASTQISFRYKVSQNALFDLTVTAPGSPTTLTGLPPVGNPPVVPDRDYNNTSGASLTHTIDNSGGTSETSSGTLVHQYWWFSAGDLRNGQFRSSELSTAASPAGGPRGTHRMTIVDVPTSTGGAEWWGFGHPGFTVDDWQPGDTSTTDLAKTRLTFYWRLAAGRRLNFRLEPDGGNWEERLDFGTHTGTGTWQLFDRTLDSAANATAFLDHLNSQNHTDFRVVVSNAADIDSYSDGDFLDLDDFTFIYDNSSDPDPDAWRTYSTTLDRASIPAAFLTALNNTGSLTLQPAFDKIPDATPGQSLTIDDFTVSYAGPSPGGGSDLVAPDASWQSYPGLAPPSGGVTDPTDPAYGFVDWIELHNTGTTPTDLTGWSISDNPDNPTKFPIPPGTTVPANGHLLLLCDERTDLNDTSPFVHTNFKLSSSGETITLTAPDTSTADTVTYPNQNAFHTFGRSPAQPTTFAFLNTSTPGAPNTGQAYPTRVASPQFLDATGQPLLGGHYPSTLTLTLSSETPGASIRYTTDGTAPTATNGSDYITPLTISRPDEKTANVIRARAFAPGLLPSGIKTQTYLVAQNSLLTGSPTLAITGDPGRDLFKPHGITAIGGGSYTVSNDNNLNALWQADGPDDYNIPAGRGQAYERETHLEYYFPPAFYPEPQEAYRGDVGIRLSSSPWSRPRLTLRSTHLSPWTRSEKEKPSFNLFWRGDFGSPKLDYPIFPGYPVSTFDNLRLRAGKNDISNPLIVEEFARRLWIDMGHVGVRGIFTSLYLNGSFKGAFNLCERIREPMFQEHYNSDLPWDVRYVNDWVDGTPDAFDAMMAALGRNLGNLTNYQDATDHFDPVNFADYYLLNIYAAMWDWPQNNFAFARERSGTDLGRFRYVVWDAEGGFDSQGYYDHPPSYNSITDDLEAKTQDVPRIWQNLTGSPEFRLLFADRVQRHLFNAGILDDRRRSDPFDDHKDALVREASPLIRYIEGTALDQSWYNTWTHPTIGRRSHLLDRGMLRNAGLWPTTEAPVLNQHGGDVPAGFQATLTSPQIIHLTTDGSDPRLPGSAVNPASQIYSAPLTISSITTLKARARSSNGEWSPLTEATFVADTSGLQITEIMYNPAGDPLAEFLEITNTGPTTIGLSGLQFTQGITFDFATSTITSLTPGARLLVVRDLAAFRATHGEDLNHLIAGTFQNSTALSNDGETITLSTTSGETVLTLTYNDAFPFPKSADGQGYSLVPTAQSTTPWRPSTTPGGNPGTTDTIPFTGSDPVSYYVHSLELSDTLTLIRNPGTDAADHTIETSPDAKTWQPTNLPLISRTPTPSGESLTYQLPQPPPPLYRLRITIP